ncbi:MAG: hypothetical protein CSB15_01060 [Clostridiales bacterium]|nr:MAG: hypothetical protein CSB15_01060 [Clostridiales bacterium]
MLTPLDIQKKTFNTSFKGYNKKEVDEFMLIVADLLDKKSDELDKCADAYKFRTEELKKYKNMESAMKGTVLLAKKTADELVKAAEDRSELLLKKAEIKVTELLTKKNEELKNIQLKIEDLKREYEEYYKLTELSTNKD